LGVADAGIPPMRSTLGGRVAQFLSIMSREAAAGSEALAGDRALPALMKKGGIAAFGGDRPASRFGHQTGIVHGGLNFSRSPTRFWHEAPGMLHDVDMSACYSTIIGRMDVYCGRPVVFEPGSRRMKLREAIALLEKSADPDAWYIRVTGDLQAGDNVLIPSTVDALTSKNYRKKKGPDPESASGRLFARRIESGIVTPDTWLMIGAMPPALRADYEGLDAESLVFYPRELAARDGADYDRLIDEIGQEPLPWEASLDLAGLKRTVVEPIDADYVSLRFPVQDIARSMAGRRREARSRSGKGCAEELTWKLQSNNIFGVLASRRYAVGNAVAANQITAAARARAWAMIQALNGIQVITDGCTYRLDQIPACTFAECLELQPDFALRRAEEGGPIPFLDPAEIPPDDEGLNTWYRDHVLRFFNVSGPEYERFFGLHHLESKETAAGTAFDALACDGAGSYLKCRRDDSGGWEVLDAAMRSHGPTSKATLAPWIVGTYSTDSLQGLPPLSRDETLLKVKDALGKARGALRSGLAEVIVPLGYEHSVVRSYRALRLSAFVCQTPGQWKALDRRFRRFTADHGCGLEVLALRRGYGGRARGSITAVAEAVFREIHRGGRDLGGALHLTRESPEVATASLARLEARELQAASSSDALLIQVDPSQHDPTTIQTAIVCRHADDPPLT
jgi:hypothetical protein